MSSRTKIIFSCVRFLSTFGAMNSRLLWPMLPLSIRPLIVLLISISPFVGYAVIVDICWHYQRKDTFVTPKRSDKRLCGSGSSAPLLVGLRPLCRYRALPDYLFAHCAEVFQKAAASAKIKFLTNDSICSCHVHLSFSFFSDISANITFHYPLYQIKLARAVCSIIRKIFWFAVGNFICGIMLIII